jgi:uncharacterized membrane protein YdjX (TVP38/TMEM64 family)
MEQKKESTPSQKKYDWWKPLLLLIIISILFIIFSFYGFGVKIGQLQNWIQTLGLWGPVVFFFIYQGAVIILIPGTIFGVIAGALFGSVEGVILISISSTVGAAIPFLIARYFARDAVGRWLSKNNTISRLDQLTKDHGMIMVAVTRLIPWFPFNILNYAFGLTKVSFKTYVFWSWLCMLPGTILVVVGTDVITQGLVKGAIPWYLLSIVIVVAFVLGILTWYLRKKQMEKKKILRNNLFDE